MRRNRAATRERRRRQARRRRAERARRPGCIEVERVQGSADDTSGLAQAFVRGGAGGLEEDACVGKAGRVIGAGRPRVELDGTERVHGPCQRVGFEREIRSRTHRRRGLNRSDVRRIVERDVPPRGRSEAVRKRSGNHGDSPEGRLQEGSDALVVCGQPRGKVLRGSLFMQHNRRLLRRGDSATCRSGKSQGLRVER